MEHDADSAQYYQGHRDDPDEWGEPITPPATYNGRLQTAVTVTFSPEEARQIRDLAQDLGMTMAEVVRQIVLAGWSQPYAAVFNADFDLSQARRPTLTPSPRSRVELTGGLVAEIRSGSLGMTAD